MTYKYTSHGVAVWMEPVLQYWKYNESNQRVKAASVRFHIMARRQKRSILEIALDGDRSYLHKHKYYISVQLSSWFTLRSSWFTLRSYYIFLINAILLVWL